MKRPSFEIIRIRFKEIETAKIDALMKRFKMPVPPTNEEVIADVLAGRVTVKRKCLCNLRDTTRWSRHYYRNDFNLNEVLRVRCVEKYLKAAKRFDEKFEPLKKKIEKMGRDMMHLVMYEDPRRYGLNGTLELFMKAKV